MHSEHTAPRARDDARDTLQGLGERQSELDLEDRVTIPNFREEELDEVLSPLTPPTPHEEA